MLVVVEPSSQDKVQSPSFFPAVSDTIVLVIIGITGHQKNARIFFAEQLPHLFPSYIYRNLPHGFAANLGTKTQTVLH